MPMDVNNIALAGSNYIDDVKNTSKDSDCNKAILSPSSENSADIQQPSKIRTTKFIQDKINNIVKKYGITYEEGMRLLSEVCHYTDEQLKTLDDDKFTKITKCLEFALMDAYSNGKVNIKKAEKLLLGYKFHTIDTKKPLTIEQAREKIAQMSKMSLVEFIKMHDEKLKDKEHVTAADLKDAIKSFILNKLSPEKIQKLKKNPNSSEAKDMATDMFALLLKNCTPEEKDLVFEAFAMLLRDEDMKEHIPTLITQMATELKENPEAMGKFFYETLPKILKSLGFSDEVIKMMNFQALQSMKPEEVAVLLQGATDFINQLGTDGVQLLNKILELKKSGNIENLTDEELAFLRQNESKIDFIISVLAVNRPELKQELQPLLDAIKNNGLEQGFFENVQIWFDNHQDLYEGVSRDDFIKNLNKLTENSYGEAIGDTNPENKYVAPEENSSDFGFAFSQNAASVGMLTQSVNSKKQGLYADETAVSDNTFYVEKKTATTVDYTTNPSEKFKTMKGLSADDIATGISNNYIKIGDVIDNYNTLSQSGKDFVNKLVEIKSPKELDYLFKGVKEVVVMTIIKRSKINPDELDICLTYANQKELERISEQRKSVIEQYV